MRLSELVSKEVINLTDATRLGVIKSAQALIDTDAGRVEAILVPYSCRGGFWERPRKTLAVPWRAIRRLGREIVIVEIRPPSKEDRRRGPIAVRENP